jgi:uncharacterized protein (TIGR03790 family)
MRTLLVLALLGACRGPQDTDDSDPIDTDDGEDTDPADTDTDPGDTDDTDVASCDLVGALIVPFEPTWPGELVALSLVDGGSGRDDISVTWEVPSGVVEPDGLTGWWTVGSDFSPHVAETARVRAVARAPGCPDQTVTGDVVVDWPENRRVVVVYNPAVTGSEDVARYYADFREIPDDAICAASSADTVTLPGDQFPDWIDAVQACIDAAGPQVHYVVPVWGVPYKVSGRIDEIADNSYKATVSLDAVAALGATNGKAATEAIWSPVMREGSSIDGTYQEYVPIGVLREELEPDPFYLVTRIDGASAEAAMELVDRTAAAEEAVAAGTLAGTVYVDARYGATPPAADDWGTYEGGEWNMWGTKRLFEDLAWYPVVFDSNFEEFGTAPALTECPDALYYAGWYSYYNYNDCFTWATGAIAGHLDSCSACDIRNPGTWSGSALIDGVTATYGAVNEPYVAGMPEYDQLFLYLTQGASFAEAGYESTYVGLWMMVWVGDPLYRPYPQ